MTALDGPLLGSAPPSGARRNFVRMSLCFSINHGCVASVLNLSVVLLGQKAGSFSQGTLYVTYALTALLASTFVISWLGSRRALIMGTFVYCVYVLSLPLALVCHDDETMLYVVALFGGAVGGVAAGFLWAAQGAYFTTSAKLHAREAGVLPTEATSALAATFSAVFLSCELLLKMAPLALKAATGGLGPRHNATMALDDAAATDGLAASDMAVAVAYSLFALGGAAAMIGIWDVEAVNRKAELQQQESHSGSAAAENGVNTPSDDSASPPGSPPPPPSPSWSKVTAAISLWFSRPVVLLLAPAQAAFGLAAALLGDLLAAEVVPKAYHDQKVVVASLLSALVALLAAALQLPFKQLSTSCGKPPVMLAGLAGFAGLALLCLQLTKERLGAAPILILCYSLQGIGRAAYEGVNKALYSDFFPEDAPAAFSNIVLANGLAAAFAFFLFPELSQTRMAATTLAVAAVAMVSYVCAELVQRRGRGGPVQ